MISIVIAHYNRLCLLRHTLKTISSTKHTLYEIIVVDDFSNNENNPSSLVDEFPNLKVFMMEKITKDKNYVNPCIVYNVGFKLSNGDKIIIQNPECCHEGDVLSYVENNLFNHNYLTFNCYASSKSDLELLHNQKNINFLEIGGGFDQGGCWYNHHSLNPTGYHFTSAISRKNLIELNGFDERYAHGLGYDDNEFLQRIKHKGLKIDHIQTPFVIHQHHNKVLKKNLVVAPFNDMLFKKTKTEKLVKSNPNKIILE